MVGGRHRTELVSEMFVRGVGFIYALAFGSLSGQLLGLVGSRGIEPAAELLSRIEQNPDGVSPLDFPSWLWVTGASDLALRGLCVAGVVCSLLVVAGKVPRLALFGAWSLYLSLCSFGGVFLSYQWDTLLLECGVVGLFVATPGSPIGIWVARALCLKLMLLSGVVKLASNDPTWRDLSALSYHFWTQPLPAWTALFANALPASVKAAMTFACLAIELGAPMCIFAPRRARLVAAAALALLQVIIAATGTYGFFNLLSLLLCAALLDDDALLSLVPKRLRAGWPQPAEAGAAEPDPAGTRRLARARRAAHIGLACLYLSLSVCVAVGRFVKLPEIVGESLSVLAPLRSVNRYGLFAMMTTERHEIALEGSLDGRTWRAYELPWKPGRLDRFPGFATPHMPRLDWQLWFASLSRCERQAWFHRLMQRILEGSPDVLSLFENDPFPSGPPRLLRTPLAEYRFAPGTAWMHGQWWARKSVGEYCPTVTLRDGRLVRAR